MFERYLAEALASQFSHIVSNFDKDKVKISVWSGEVVLRDLTLKEDALQQLSKKAKANAKAHPHLRRAYVMWETSKVNAWKATHLFSATVEQREFVKAIINRCSEEREEMLADAVPKRSRKAAAVASQRLMSEPLRACLFGIPGAGKSHCIKLLRSFFEECLQWEHGVQFQFLASQNTMAALIGGSTIHSWASIPINAIDAASKSIGKSADGDIDELFLKVAGLRWVFMDEVSTAAPGLFGTLDAYLSRACMRHPYAARGRSRRPLGGLNFIFAGDLWQLPPVRAAAIFSNPFKKTYSFEEQKGLKMFWSKGFDSVAHTFLLTRSMRTKDIWLNEVLHAQRYGSEPWEIYCFMHGLPTRNTGTWLPSTGKPACENERCLKLSMEVWPEMWRRDCGRGWATRSDMECEKCKAERARRRRVVPLGSPDAGLYRKKPFAHAPFVHPFRHPSYHAQQLRAVTFARTAQRRLLWVVAHDKLLQQDKSHRKDTEELRKERWLEFHDRFTAGLPGLLPLALDLPVCFTDTPSAEARQMGVFKNARGKIKGWLLSPEEQERLEQCAEAEVVLRQRPRAIFIEVESATDKMPVVGDKRIFTLRVQVKQWSLDANGQVKVRRFGFPIVPDFGGTAHAYCGSTLDACIGDLLPWYHRPRRDDALRAYIVMSRVQDVSDILLAQPYSPQLFRQGVLPGPDLLQKVLKDEITIEVAKRLWKEDSGEGPQCEEG